MKVLLRVAKWRVALLTEDDIESIPLNRALFQRLNMRNQQLKKNSDIALHEAEKLRKQMVKMQKTYEKKIAVLRQVESLNKMEA